MSSCTERVSRWRLLFLSILCVDIFFCQYTNTIFRMVAEETQAVLKPKLGTAPDYLKRMQHALESIHKDVPAGDPVNTTDRKPGTTTSPPVKESTAISADATESIEFFVQKLKAKILRHESAPLLTLFTTWTENPEKYLVHNITTHNWLSLRPYVIPVVFTNEASIVDACLASGWDVYPASRTAAEGVPVLKYMYKDVMDTYNTSFYAYSNSDILYTEGLVNTLAAITANSGVDLSKPLMIVGKRTNVDHVTEEDAFTLENVTAVAKRKGHLYFGCAEDFFITTPNYPWMKMANVVIGRRAYDNWLVYNARKQKHKVLDATRTIVAVHQTTKAGNLEGSQHKNKNYNHNLLLKMYKHINYNAGSVGCAEEYTMLENNWINIKKRTPSNGCNL